MERKINEEFIKWKKDDNKKNLLLYGMRQIGKTYSTIEFGKEFYKNIEEINEKTNLLSGRTDSSIIIEFEGSKDLIGSFRNVEVTEARNWILRGKLTD